MGLNFNFPFLFESLIVFLYDAINYNNNNNKKKNSLIVHRYRNRSFASYRRIAIVKLVK